MNYCLMLLLSALSLGQAAASRPELQETQFGFAGIKLGLPAGFERQMVSSPMMAFRAAKLKNQQPVLAISLLAVPQEAKVSLEEFAKSTQPSREDLSVRQYRQLKTTPIKVASGPGQAVLVTYEYRGAPTTALMIYFLRPLKIGKLDAQLGYILTGEADTDNARQIMPLLCGVADTIQLADILKPLDEKVEQLGQPVTSKAHGYTICPPANWKVNVNRGMSDVHMFQTDYQRGGLANPEVHLLLKETSLSAKELGLQDLKQLEEALTKQKQEYKVIRQGPVQMAGQEAYEFLIRQTVPGRNEDEPPMTVLFYLRSVSANGRSYSLTTMARSDDTEQLTTLVNKISATLEITSVAPPSTSQPASAPPAAPRTPASAPASPATIAPPSLGGN